MDGLAASSPLPECIDPAAPPLIILRSGGAWEAGEEPQGDGDGKGKEARKRRNEGEISTVNIGDGEERTRRRRQKKHRSGGGWPEME